jgi:hypothetical protein
MPTSITNFWSRWGTYELPNPSKEKFQGYTLKRKRRKLKKKREIEKTTNKEGKKYLEAERKKDGGLKEAVGKGKQAMGRRRERGEA